MSSAAAESQLDSQMFVDVLLLLVFPPLILCTFLSSNVKWVFMGDSDSCKGSGCPSMDPSFFGGAGMTMLEWVSTPGFLEQVIRNEHVRRDIRTRISGW